MGASLCRTVEVGAMEVSWNGGMGDRRFAGKSSRGRGRRKTWGGKAKVGSFYVRSRLQWERDPKEPTSTGVGSNRPDLIGDLERFFFEFNRTPISRRASKLNEGSQNYIDAMLNHTS